VVILDVLHYLDAQSQRDVLKRCLLYTSRCV